MPGYQVKFDTVTVGGIDYRIRSLLDRQQYADPLGDAERAGVPEAGWSLFGQMWPSARVLALEMHTYALAGQRILEIGAGLALASLVLHRRGGAVTVSDRHPLCHPFLNENLKLNLLGPLPYSAGNWDTDNPELGRFDLIIGSDLLYERDHPAQLAGFIDRHAAPECQIIIVDPDRGNRVPFCREMTARGYGFYARRAALQMESGEAYKGRFLFFQQPPPLLLAQ